MQFYKLSLKVLRSSADLPLHDREFHAKRALTLNAFDENADTIRATETDSLSDEHNVCAGQWRSQGGMGACTSVVAGN